MAEITYLIEAKGPLALNERKPGGSQYQESYEVIPGAVVRGALASLLLPTCQDRLNQQNHNHCPQPALCRAIFGDQARFCDAIPTGRQSKRQGMLPTTAYSCKNNAGFANKPQPDKTDNKHGIFDTLIDRAIWELNAPPAMQYLPTCPTCGGRTTAVSGPYSVDTLVRKSAAGNAEGLTEQVVRHRRSVARELFTRVAINRRRAVAEDELLYAVSAITERTLDPSIRATDTDVSPQELFPPTCFVGSIWRPDEEEEQEEEVHQQLADLLTQIRHVGSGHTRGLGRVAVQTIGERRRPDLAERIANFNARFAERAALWGVPPSPAGYFTVNLQSDAILTVDGWTPTLRLEPELIWRALGEAGNAPDLTLVRAYTTPVTRGGWNGIYGLRKESATCVQAGGVYLFATTALPEWTQHLAKLECVGVGERRVEGFGQLQICDEIHTLAVGSVL
jgi:CRISPR-associated protein Csx10